MSIKGQTCQSHSLVSWETWTSSYIKKNLCGGFRGLVGLFMYWDRSLWTAKHNISSLCATHASKVAMSPKKIYLGNLESMPGCSDRTGLLLSSTVLEWRRREAHLLCCQTACAAVKLTLRTCTFSNIQISTKHKNGWQCYIGTTWGEICICTFLYLDPE